MINLTAWVLLFPLLGFIILGLTGRFMSRTAILTVAWGACGLAFVCAAISFLSMLGTPVNNRSSDQILYTWVVSGDFQLSFGLLFDQLSGIMLLIVTGVGLLIHIYSAGYMKGDASFWRFFAFLNFFIFAMVLLVSSDNFLFLLVGWGLVGLASFLLIGFWYRKRSAVEAARKAIVINVIGDFGLMIAIFLIFRQYTALNFFTNTSNGAVGVFNLLDTTTRGHLLPTVIALLLFLACAAKSAQLPLYMWLPDAMEGPTPVSALIHAATMVTAGVYLVARAHPLFELAPQALNVVAVIGGHHRHFRRQHRPFPTRHQARAGLFDHQPAWLHVHGRRRQQLFSRYLSPHHTRLLQGPALYGGRRGNLQRWQVSKICVQWAACARNCPSPSGHS